MSSFTATPFTTNPWTTEPFTTNPWVADNALYFTNTGASLDPYIEVTGTPEILWTWSDGTTDNVANPGSKTLTGTHTLLVTPWDAVTRFNFDSRGLTGGFKTQAWLGVDRIYIQANDLIDNFVTHVWPRMVNLQIHYNDFSGDFVFQTWPVLRYLLANNNKISSVSGSLQTQVLIRTLWFYNNSISSSAQIDKMLSDLVVNAGAAGRTATCEVNFSGSEMSGPTGAGTADKDILINTYGWTVTLEPEV